MTGSEQHRPTAKDMDKESHSSDVPGVSTLRSTSQSARDILDVSVNRPARPFCFSLDDKGGGRCLQRVANSHLDSYPLEQKQFVELVRCDQMPIFDTRKYSDVMSDVHDSPGRQVTSNAARKEGDSPMFAESLRFDASARSLRQTSKDVITPDSGIWTGEVLSSDSSVFRFSSSHMAGNREDCSDILSGPLSKILTGEVPQNTCSEIVSKTFNGHLQYCSPSKEVFPQNTELEMNTLRDKLGRHNIISVGNSPNDGNISQTSNVYFKPNNKVLTNVDRPTLPYRSECSTFPSMASSSDSCNVQFHVSSEIENEEDSHLSDLSLSMYDNVFSSEESLLSCTTMQGNDTQSNTSSWSSSNSEAQMPPIGVRPVQQEHSTRHFQPLKCQQELGGNRGFKLSDQLDLELVRLEVLVDSLQQIEDQMDMNANNISNQTEYVCDIQDPYAKPGQAMERARPPRSGIPTPVGSVNGRAGGGGPPPHSRPPPPPRPQKRDADPCYEGLVQATSSCRDSNGHGIRVGPPPVMTKPGKGTASRHGQSAGPTMGTRNRTPPRQLEKDALTLTEAGGSHQNMRTPGRRYKDSSYVQDARLIKNQPDYQDRSVDGCESSPSFVYETPADLKNQEMSFQQLKTEGHFDDRCNGNVDQCGIVTKGSDSYNNNNNTKRQNRDEYLIQTQDSLSLHPETRSSSRTSDLAGNVHNLPVDQVNCDGSAISHQDYPIRGTISPLTSQGLVKRSVGPVDEVSFVFGRPASPPSERTPKAKGRSASSSSSPMARCLSPSSGRRYSHNTRGRPMSPSSDVMPLRHHDVMPHRRGPGSGGRPDRRTFSPPPNNVLGAGTAADLRIHQQGGICCEHCNGCLVELKRQALRLMFPDQGTGGYLAQTIRVDNISDRLTVPESYERWYSASGQCGVCETPVDQLKREALSMIQSIQLAQATATTATNIPALVGSCGLPPSHPRARYSRSSKPPTSPIYASSISLPSSSPSSVQSPSMPIAAQAQAYLDQNVRAYVHPNKYSQAMASRASPSPYDSPVPGQSSPYSAPWPGHAHPCHVPSMSVPSSALSSPGTPPPGPSAAVSFFARAAQKLSKKKKRHHSQESEPLPCYPTRYSEVIRLTPPPAPPCLLRNVGRLQNPGMGKVKVMLKICNPSTSQGEHSATFISADPRKKQVTLVDPSASGYVTSANRRAATAAPKMFAFDSVFTPDDSLTEICAGSLSEILQAVVAGADGCLFTYGYSKLGKSHTMLGMDQTGSTIGIMPCAIAWLFKLINDQRDKTGARFSVRVSAVHVSGRQEVLKDLLADAAQGAEANGVGAAPSVYLREDPICGTQLENQSELRAPTADKAAHYLDAALAARNVADEDEARSSHMLFTLNVYQYRIEKANTKAGLPGVAGGRSRLHLIDLGTASKSKDASNVSLSLSALGNVIMALLHGQRHVPHRDSKIAQLLRDSLGNLSCRTCMIAHVSAAVPHYNETLQVIQLAARIHRMKRRRTKFSSTSSEDSSTDGDVKFRRPYRGLRMGTLREDMLYSSSHSDPDYTSSSEQSCDTVIYIGANGQSLSDRELTDNEGPPRHVPRTNPRLPRRPSGSRSSGDDSDSGRSVRSVRSVKCMDSRLPLRTAVSNVAGPSGQVQSMPSSPNTGMVKMGHRMGVHSKAGISSESASGSVDKPTKVHVHSSQGKLARSIHEKQKPLEGEQWIDGPGAAIYPEPKASEMWVDGPQAFVVKPPDQRQANASALSSAPPSRSDGSHHHRSDSSSHHHRSDSVRRGAGRKVNAEEQWVDGPKEMLSSVNPEQPMHTCSKIETKATPQAGVNEKALKHALAKHIMDSKDPKRESSCSVDSNCSNAAEPAESRPQSFLDSDDQGKSSSLKEASENEAAPMGLPQKPRKMSEGQLSQSLKHSPSPSPGQTRKGHKMDAAHASRLQKSQLPGSASPTHRVRQWIKSVVTEQPDESSLQEGTKTSSEATCPPPKSLTSILMADAETNTEHDSDFERLADENGGKSDEEGGDNDAVNWNSEKCNKTLDVSMDSSCDTAGIMRDSIYEIEVEERLELIKSKDNETFSSMSCSARDQDEADGGGLETDSLLVQHTKALTESRQTANLARHLAGDGSVKKRDTSPAYSDYDNEALDVTKPLLSRKPDGASNPNLTSCCEGRPLGKNNFSTVGEATVESVYVLAGQIEPEIDQFESDSFCDSNFPEQLAGKGDSGFPSSPVLSTKSKPPLPVKSSPVLKHSRLPKCSAAPVSSPSTLSQHSSSSKSGHLGKESSPDPLQRVSQGSSGKLSSPSLKSRLCSRASSSGTSQSPASSATSSPLVSTTSKSSSSVTSSPSMKAKHPSGLVSKMPFCSSRSFSPSGKDGKSRKKEKDAKGGSARMPKTPDLKHKLKGNDSDSGNDSGIVAHEKRLLSPYATVTKPRTPSHSSSGHGSDNSTVSTEVHAGHVRPIPKPDTIHGGTSSGYESMLRDSEATGSSSGHDDSGSESLTDGKKGGKHKGTRRSRSAPAYSREGSPSLGQGHGSCKSGSGTKAWVDTRHLHKMNEEPLELKNYDTDDVERLTARRRQEEEMKKDGKSDDGKEAKEHVLMERNGWSFDCKFLMCFSCKSRQRSSDV